MSRDRSAFCQALLDFFDGCYESPSGEVWVRYADALEAVDLADRMGLRLLGMEGLLVDGTDIFPAMSRIADFGDADTATAQTTARSILRGTWAEPPQDVHSEAKGEYLIALVVAEQARRFPVPARLLGRGTGILARLILTPALVWCPTVSFPRAHSDDNGRASARASSVGWIMFDRNDAWGSS